MIVTGDHVLGHESAGQVVAVGPDVKTLKAGAAKDVPATLTSE